MHEYLLGMSFDLGNVREENVQGAMRSTEL